MGAGILPLAVFRSSIYLLLGQERHNNLWSDFGGSSLEGETIYQTAIREGYEETNGFLGEKNEMYKNVEKNLLYELDNNDKYTSFVYKTKYYQSLPKIYKRNNKFIEFSLPEKIINGDNGLFEKRNIKWFNLNYFDIEENRELVRPYYYPIIEQLLNNKEEIFEILK